MDIEWSERLVADITEDALELIGSHEDLNDAVTSAIGSHVAFAPCYSGVVIIRLTRREHENRVSLFYLSFK